MKLAYCSVCNPIREVYHPFETICPFFLFLQQNLVVCLRPVVPQRSTILITGIIIWNQTPQVSRWNSAEDRE